MGTKTNSKNRRAIRRLYVTEIGGVIALVAVCIGTYQGLLQFALHTYQSV